MGLSVGELFINLGIKGSEKTIGAIGDAQKGMKGLGSVSLEAKAAIVGVFYAFERLLSASSQYGTRLENFGALTGLSAAKLQEWEYAARQVGVGADEMAGSIKGVQSAMSKMIMGEGAPKGLGLIANATRSFDVNRVRDTFYVLNQLQEAAKKLPKDLGNEALKSFGLSENTIAAMRRNAFRPDVMKRAPVYSERETAALDHANALWANLGNSIERAFGKFNVQHGGQLVQDLTKMSDALITLAGSLVKVAEQFKAFELATKFVTELAGALNDISKWQAGKRSFWGEDLDEKGKVKGDRSVTGATFGNFFDIMRELWNTPAPKISESERIYNAVHGSVKPIFGPSPGSQQNVEINQTLQFQHEGKDHKRTSDDVGKAVQKAYRQMSAQGQGS